MLILYMFAKMKRNRF